MINVAMWGKALRIIPRLNKPEWDALDIVSRWLVATRAAVFVMTAASCGVGALLAYRDGAFSWPFFAACLVGLVFAHATNNLVNDLTDHLKGVDKDNYFRAQYGPQPLEHGLLTKRQLLGYIAVSGLIAAGAGLYLVVATGTTTLWLMLAGAFFVLFYTWPLKYIGLGELAVVVVWGPLMVGGSYFVVSGGHWDWNICWISLAYAIGPTTVLFGKHTDKLAQDREKKIRTLPVIIGEPAARYSVIALLALQLLGIVALVATRALGWAMLLTLLAIPDLVRLSRAYAKPRPTERPADFPEEGWPLYLVAIAFIYTRRFSGYFLGGMILDVVLKKLAVY